MSKKAPVDSAPSIQNLQGRDSLYWLITNIFLVSTSLLVMIQGIFAGEQLRFNSAEAQHYWRLSSIVLPGITTVFCLYLTSKRKALRRQADTVRTLHQEVDRLDGQMQETMRINDVKDGFLANLSHEVRTPITTILGFSEILLTSDVSAEERKSALGAIYQNGKHLHQLVNDLLDYSEMNSGCMSVVNERCSPADIIRDAAALCRPAALHSGLDFNVTIADSLPDEMETDPLRLRQVIINLLMNAIKFTGSGGVGIAAAPSQSDPSAIDIDVSDTGAGIDESLWSVLFDPFVQGDGSSTRRHGGTGLGLAICRHLVSLLGGTIELKSRLGEGSTFTIHLPLVARPGKSGGEAAEPRGREEVCTLELPQTDLVAPPQSDRS